MPVALIDQQELFEFISDHGVKNLNSFRVQAKLSRLSRKYDLLLHKEPVIAYTYLGIIEAYKNNYDVSVNYLNNALRLAPSETVVLQNLAKVYEQHGDYKKAMETYLSALKLTPFDQEIFTNTFLLAEFYCEINVLDELKDINPDLFLKDGLSPAYRLYDFLKEKDFDFENYRSQLACAFKVIHRHLNIRQSKIEKFYNYDGSYLSNIIEVEDATVELLNIITSEYEEEIFKIASEQPDGGFDFYEKLSQSSLTFSFLHSESRHIA